MSIKTWKEEFGQTKLSRIRGLSKENLRKHKVSANSGKLYGMKYLGRGARTSECVSVFKNGFDECCTVTEEQYAAYIEWIKTNDATNLIKSFREPIWQRFKTWIHTYLLLLPNSISFVL